jgi:hypothetical protein
VPETLLRAFCLLGLLLCSRLALAQAEPPTLVVEVLPGAAELDPAALRQGVAAELAVRVVAPGEPGSGSAEGAFTIGVDREKSEIVIEFRGRAASSLVRRFPLSIDRTRVQQNVVFLVGNMARDESRELLRDLRRDDVEPAPPAATSAPVEASRAEPTPRRFWLGIEAEPAIGLVAEVNDVCGAPSGFHCLTPGGQEYAPPGPQGTVGTGLALASSRFTVSFHHARHDNWLVGGRLGFAVGRYPGGKATTWGPTHLEVRATYVLGDRALVQPGVRLAVTAGAGMAQWDTKIPVSVRGDPPLVDAWRVRAGFFVSGAVGPRIVLGERAAIVVNAVKLTALVAAISDTGAALLFTPELGVELGF